jgi:hypothetical protein
MRLRVSKVNPGGGWDTLGEEGELLGGETVCLLFELSCTTFVPEYKHLLTFVDHV